MISWLKDPVTSFVIAGTAIFLLSGMFSNSEISRVIELSDADVEETQRQLADAEEARAF